MARTGRFGRLPTQAPDLSSQIVSLMEQWQAAEDRNILEAWTNGGRYNGKKVTDKTIMDYYRKRRNGYDRDDPEWTEWDNELWQLRFQVSNETVLMKYRNGNLGAAAVAQHYREWARKMPKHSSYYRNLMATAGDYAKAAAAAKGSSAFDYKAMQERIAAQDRKIAAGERVVFAIDKYARQHGLISGEQSITDPGALNFWEAGLMEAVLDGTVNSGEWNRVIDGVQTVYPQFREQSITHEKLRNVIDQQNRASREKMRIWREAPSDYSYYINAERDAIRSRKNAAVYLANLDEYAKMAVIWDTWSGESEGDMGEGYEGHAGAHNPLDYLAGDKDMLTAVKSSLEVFQENGQDDAAFAANIMKWVAQAGSADPDVRKRALANIHGIEGTTTLLGPAFDSVGEIEARANQQVVMRNMTDRALRREIAIDPHGQGDISEIEGELGVPTDIRFNWMEMPIDPVTGLPAVTDKSMGIIAHVQGSKREGFNVIPLVYHGKAVVDNNRGTEPTTVGYVFDVEGQKVYGVFSPDGRTMDYVNVDPWAASNIPLRDEGQQFSVTYGVDAPKEGYPNPDVNTVAEMRERLMSLIPPETLAEMSPVEVEEFQQEFEDWTDYLAGMGPDYVMADPGLRAMAEATIDQTHPNWRNQAAMYPAEMQAQAEDAFLKKSLNDSMAFDPEYTPTYNETDAMFFDTEGVLRSQPVTDSTALTTDMQAYAQRDFLNPAATVMQNDPAFFGKDRVEASTQWLHDLVGSIGYSTLNQAYITSNEELMKQRAQVPMESILAVDSMNGGTVEEQTRMRDSWTGIWSMSQAQPMMQRLVMDGATPEVVEAGAWEGLRQGALDYAEQGRETWSQATGFDPEMYQPGEAGQASIFNTGVKPASGIELREPGISRAEELMPITPVKPVTEVAQPSLNVADNIKPLVGMGSGKVPNPNVRLGAMPGFNFNPLPTLNVPTPRFNVPNVTPNIPSIITGTGGAPGTTSPRAAPPVPSIITGG